MLIGLRENPQFCWTNFASCGKAMIMDLFSKEIDRSLKGKSLKVMKLDVFQKSLETGDPQEQLNIMEKYGLRSITILIAHFEYFFLSDSNPRVDVIKFSNSDSFYDLKSVNKVKMMKKEVNGFLLGP